MSQSLLCHWFQTWTARWLPARTYSSRSESDFAEDGEVSWERNNPAIKSPPYEVFFSLLQKKRFCIINRVMHVQTRCMAAVLLLWIPWALRLVISLAMILVRWYELVSWFFSLLWPPRMVHNNNGNPVRKTTSTDYASRFLAPQRVISYQNTKPRKQIGSLNCIPR